MIYKQLKSARLSYLYILKQKMGFLLGHHTYLHISLGSGQFHLVPGPSLAVQLLGSCISLEGGENRERHMRVESVCEFFLLSIAL